MRDVEVYFFFDLMSIISGVLFLVSPRTCVSRCDVGRIIENRYSVDAALPFGTLGTPLPSPSVRRVGYRVHWACCVSASGVESRPGHIHNRRLGS